VHKGQVMTMKVKSLTLYVFACLYSIIYSLLKYHIAVRQELCSLEAAIVKELSKL
jgi:hypothetical protein